MEFDLSGIPYLLEKYCPIYMKRGGGGLQRCASSRIKGEPQYIGPKLRARMSELIEAGHSIREVANITGRPYSTVETITRAARQRINYKKRAA